MYASRIATLSGALTLFTGFGLVTLFPAHAQDRPLDLEVHGAVRQAGSGLPIPKALVRFEKSGTREAVETVSDLFGNFSVALREPGLYFVLAEAAGYVKPSALDRPPPKLLVRPDAKRLWVDLELHPSVTVTGRIVDQDTGEPAPNLMVRPFTARYMRGRLTLLPVAPPAASDAEGRFHLDQLPPGEYLLEISPQQAETITPGSPPDYGEENPRPRCYSRSFWPPGSESADIPPLWFRAGGSYHLGKIPLPRHPAYHVAGSLELSSCADQDQVRLSLTERFGSTTLRRARASIPCGSPFTIRGLTPYADYRLSAWTPGRRADQRAFFQAPLRVASDDLELPLRLRQPGRLICRVELQDHIGPHPPTRFSVRIRPLETLAFADEPSVTTVPGEDFTLPFFERGEHEVIVTGLRHPLYLREVVYNGHRLISPVFAPDYGARQHFLRIVIAGDGSAVKGTVRTPDDLPAAGTFVIIAPWPPRNRDGYPEAKTVQADENGAFEARGLGPGEYRIVTATPAGRRRLQRTGDFVAALSAATHVTLRPRDVIRLSLELQVPD